MARHLFAFAVDTLIFVVPGKKGQQERSTRSKYEWSQKKDTREMFKQAKPVRPGSKRDQQQQQQQQHKLDKNRKTNIFQAAAQTQKSRYVFTVVSRCYIKIKQSKEYCDN